MGDRPISSILPGLKVRFDRRGKPSSDSSLAKLERKIGRPLAADYTAFMKRHTGAMFDLHKIEVSSLNPLLGVAEIFSVSTSLRITERLGALSRRFLVFAAAGFGNFFLFDHTQNFEVHYWDKTTPFKTTYVASSFTQFMEMMVPMSPDEVPYPADAEVWINPAFQDEWERIQREYGIERSTAE